MRDWILRWLGTAKPSPLEMLISQQAEINRELMAALKRRDEQVDRVLMAKFDRPQVSAQEVKQDERRIPEQMFTDVLNAPTDEQFMAMAQQMMGN